EADDGEDGGGDNDHEEGDGDGGLELVGVELEEDGAGEDFGFQSRGAGKDINGAEFTERARPGERECGDHAAPGLGQGDPPEGLQAAAAERHGDELGAGVDFVESDTHGTDGEGGRGGELGEDNGGDGEGD